MKSTNFIVSELHVIGNNIRQLTSRFFGSLQVWKYYNIYTLQLFLVGTKCSARSFFTLFLLMRVSFFVLDMYFTSANKPLLLETVSLNHCIVQVSILLQLHIYVYLDLTWKFSDWQSSLQFFYSILMEYQGYSITDLMYAMYRGWTK